MRNSAFIWIILVIITLLDFYVFQAVKAVSQGASQRWRMIIYNSYWGISLAIILILLLIPFLGTDLWPKSIRNYLFATVIGFFFAELLVTVFLLVDDIRRLVQWGSGKLFFRNTEGENMNGDGISRSLFLSWLGLGLGGTLFSTLIYGFCNKYNYQVRRIQLSFGNLPSAFKGLKIVQISDIHSGSFMNTGSFKGCRQNIK